MPIVKCSCSLGMGIAGVLLALITYAIAWSLIHVMRACATATFFDGILFF